MAFIGIAVAVTAAAAAAVSVARGLNLIVVVAGLQVRGFIGGRDFIDGAFASRNDFLAILPIHPIVFGNDFEPALSVFVPIFVQVQVLVPPEIGRASV